MIVSFVGHAFIMEPSFQDRRAKRPFFKRIGPYLPSVMLLSVAVSALIYLAVMQLMGWRTPVFGVSGGLTYAAPTGNSVILYASPNTKTYLSGIGGNYETLLVPWRGYFSNRKRAYKEATDIAQVRELKEGVLVLPSALSLNAEERAEILAFRLRGGAILSTWATGTRNSNGDWEGWQFLERLGVKMVGEIPATTEGLHLVLNGESPVSHTHPAGQRIGLSKTSEALLRFKGEVVAGRFMNWARVHDEARRDEGAILFSEASATIGRVAFFAFAESVWESRPIAAYDFIDNSIQWLQREPSIVVAAWPNGKRAAQVIEMDTEDGFTNAIPFSLMMKSLDYPTTFYLLTSVAKLFPNVVTQLANGFELGYHGDIHDSFKGQSNQQQEQRIQMMQADLRSLLPDTQRVTGFRAPTEGYDTTTEKLLQKYGIRHHAGDPSRTDGRIPILAKLEGVNKEDTLVVLPRTQRDDINLYKESLSSEQMTQALISDFDLAVEHGALGLLSIHSQNFKTDSPLTKAMPGFLVHMKQRNKQVWVASAGDVAGWWRDRDRFKLSFRNTGRRLEFNITVTGDKPLNGASLVIMLPQKGITATVQSTKTDGLKPTVTKIDDYRATVVFDTLSPGNYVYQATFAP
jgi:peptidoglycan/xylan/chitin deacetylase (PgdA/CDA1 family)